MNYRDATKSGFFELLSARNEYRDISTCIGVPMHRDLIVHFITTQYTIIAPVCPHICEHVWTLLGNEGSMISNARWPESGVSLTVVVHHCRFDWNIVNLHRARVAFGRDLSRCPRRCDCYDTNVCDLRTSFLPLLCPCHSPCVFIHAFSHTAGPQLVSTCLCSLSKYCDVCVTANSWLNRDLLYMGGLCKVCHFVVIFFVF